MRPDFVEGVQEDTSGQVHPKFCPKGCKLETLNCRGCDEFDGLLWQYAAWEGFSWVAVMCAAHRLEVTA
jgi:hypothetical protein